MFSLCALSAGTTVGFEEPVPVVRRPGVWLRMLVYRRLFEEARLKLLYLHWYGRGSSEEWEVIGRKLLFVWYRLEELPVDGATRAERDRIQNEIRLLMRLHLWIQDNDL